MSQITESISDLSTDVLEIEELKDNSPSIPVVEPLLSAIGSPGNRTLLEVHEPPGKAQCSGAQSIPALAAQDLSPTDVQRLVVEHIVKRDENALHSQSSARLQAFSGKVPRPSHEPDYDTWRSSVKLIINDPSVSELRRSRRILESVLPSVANVVRHLSPNTC